MSKLDVTEIIKGVKQPTFDDEMLMLLIQGLESDTSFYNFIQKQNGIVTSTSQIDMEAEHELWQKKVPGYKQGDAFRHMGYTGDIDYAFSRLYVNCDKCDLMELAKLFTDKCFSQEIPVYFKYAIGSENRTDQMVIYSNLDNLSDYIAILQQIAQENPDIKKRCGKPPLLTGKIDEWIGIGDEPTVTDTSYTEIRANIIEDTLRKILPRLIDEKEGFEFFDIDNVDFDIVREELRKAFEEAEINIDTFAFNNENLQLYMSDEQTRLTYSQERKQKIQDEKKRKKDDKQLQEDYLGEQFSIQELKLLKQMGVMPEIIETMINATKSRYALLSDITGKKVNTSEYLQSKFGLPANTLVSDKNEVQVRRPEGLVDMPDDKKEKLASLMLEDLTKYYTGFFNQEQANLEDTLSRYSEIVVMPTGDNRDIDIERADLLSKLTLLIKGKDFFRTIGIPDDSLETVCNRVQDFLQEVTQKSEEEQHPEMEARRKFTDRDFLHAIFQETGITNAEELRRLYEEQDEIKVDEDDLETVLTMFSDNVSITPTQIEEVSRNVGIGIKDINETTRGIRNDLTQDKQTDKGEGSTK